MRPYAVYEHPDFSPSPKDTSTAAFYAVIGSLALVGAASTAVVYQFVNTGKVWQGSIFGLH